MTNSKRLGAVLFGALVTAGMATPVVAADVSAGADLYSAGKSRGAGGSGVWRDGRLHASKNFRRSRVLAAG